MFSSLLRAANLSKKYFYTYNSGLLQAKAYRVLKKHIAKTLQPFSLTSVEWAILGQLNDNKQMRIAELSHILDVEGPFITRIIDDLIEKELVERTVDEKDARARLVVLTVKGKKLIPKVEKVMKETMKELVNGLPLKDIVVYIRVLEFLAAKSS